jgi:Protein of unknown function (DUF2695)
MTALELQNHLNGFIQPAMPEIIIRVEINEEKEDDATHRIYFIDDSFVNLFPKQRYHKLIHLIPDDFFNQHLEQTHWFELAPGEKVDDLDYHDEELIEEIKEPILSILKHKVNFVSLLDNEFIKKNAICKSDFSYSRAILNQLEFSAVDQFDIFHVLMNEGGYCDCEILYNVFRESSYAQKYWAART